MLGSWWGLSIEVRVDVYIIFFCSDWAYDLCRNRGLLLVFLLVSRFGMLLLNEFVCLSALL